MSAVVKEDHMIPILCLDLWEHAYYLKVGGYMRGEAGVWGWDELS
jgi:superoxide dismutase